LRHVAWVLATYPKAAVRNGPRAVELAQQTNRLSGGTNAMIVGTLAAAFAEAGRFPEAIAAARRAVQLATTESNAALVHDLQVHLRSYEAGQPYRDSPGATG
jgi:hypothetical protein